MGRLRQFEREEIFDRDGYTCQHCDQSVGLPGKQPQLAHLIPNTDEMRSRYGKEVVDHPQNRVLTCSLYCNNVVQLTNKPVEADALAEEIRSSL